jgi:hypothetical protein
MNKTYRQSTAVQIVAGTFILLLTPICIVFWDAYQKGELDDPLLFALLMLIFSPFYGVACVILWRFNGCFHLTNHAIILKQLGRSITNHNQQPINLSPKPIVFTKQGIWKRPFLSTNKPSTSTQLT